tara:strand:+ start:235 stop:1020 length:786 start_codon:yes stop_codon:yes gene_type:complete
MIKYKELDNKYLKINKDVKKDKYWCNNPYKHYLKYGKNEGRFYFEKIEVEEMRKKLLFLIDKIDNVVVHTKEPKFIYFKVSKTAGTSIHRYSLDKLLENEDGHTYFNYKEHRPLYRKWVNNCNNFDEYFKFVIVRNPYDRLISAFTFNKQIGKIGEESLLREFIEDKDKMKYHKKSGYHHYPQAECIYTDNDKLIVDYIGKFENLDIVWFEICYYLGFSYKKLQKKKSSEHEHYRRYFNEEDKKLTDLFLSDDIKKLDYSF